MATNSTSHRIEHGDWQTPHDLAASVVALTVSRGLSPSVVVEPTCGRGAFLQAAARAFPTADLIGFDIAEEHIAAAGTALAGTRATLHRADFFAVDWDAVFAGARGTVLLLGNPPWVTSSTLGMLESVNVPEKVNFKNHRGMDARTGKANFDISEWMLLHLLERIQHRPFALAMLCKSSVARRVLEITAERLWAISGALYRIDAKTHFDASVDAVLLVIESDTGSGVEREWAVFGGLEDTAPQCFFGVVDGTLYSDLAAYRRTSSLAGRSEIEWRSGVKHDCAQVMELRRRGGLLMNGLDEVVDVEPLCLYPSCKGSDVANGRTPNDRWMLVTQRALGEDTTALRERAPKTWAYLEAHRVHLDARKSSIYQAQPPFAMFGIGDYSFAPYKVAICGLYKRVAFTVVGPVDGRPVMLDDTTYFLPCRTREHASDLVRVLNCERARAFLGARIFWDAKRPINKAILQSLSLDALLRAEGFDRGIAAIDGVRQLGLAGIG